jgi:hypothetical protein
MAAGRKKKRKKKRKSAAILAGAQGWRRRPGVYDGAGFAGSNATVLIEAERNIPRSSNQTQRANGVSMCCATHSATMIGPPHFGRTTSPASKLSFVT